MSAVPSVKLIAVNGGHAGTKKGPNWGHAILFLLLFSCRLDSWVYQFPSMQSPFAAVGPLCHMLRAA